MLRDIRESDWKVFRQVRTAALERFCENVLREITSFASDATRTPHERYLEIYKLVRERDQMLADAFNDV